MTRSASGKLRAYLILCVVGLGAALAFRRPELVVLAAPFALGVLLGLRDLHDPGLRLAAELDAGRALEGDEVVLAIEGRTTGSPGRLELQVAVPRGLVALTRNPVEIDVGPEASRAHVRVRCERWGAYELGTVVARVHGPLRMVRHTARFELDMPLRVYPTPESVRSLVMPFATQVYSGNEVAREVAEGIEFADLREFQPGDRQRDVNWRVSARRNRLWVNARHPERNTDVVLFLDSFAGAGTDVDGTFVLAVRALAGLADRYAAHRDRIGLVSFGGVLNWLEPGMGQRQLYRVLDALIDTEVTMGRYWRDISALPRRTLPPRALVIGLTPLLDRRSASALFDLNGRGFDVAVIEVDPEPFVPPGRAKLDPLAHRLWLLRREAVRDAYRRAGLALATWRPADPFSIPLEEVTAFRRSVRRVRA